MNFKEQLSRLESTFTDGLDDDQMKVIYDAMATISNDLENRISHGLGDYFPRFTLPTSDAELVGLADFTADFLVIAIYQGGWNPFCNIQLQGLQSIKQELKGMNTQILAISPETHDKAQKTKKVNKLTFPIISDIDNQLTETLGFTYQMPKEMFALYEKLDFKFEKYNGNFKKELPIPTLLILNKERQIIEKRRLKTPMERVSPFEIIRVMKQQHILA